MRHTTYRMNFRSAQNRFRNPNVQEKTDLEEIKEFFGIISCCLPRFYLTVANRQTAGLILYITCTCLQNFATR
nr:MAG TPA: hypothetical protein [Caudoviricetes sp.]